MDKEMELISVQMKVINIGIDSFLESLKDQEVEVVHVDWCPPAGGDSVLIDILDKLDML